MSVNPNVYGSKNSWLSLIAGSTIKFANFGDDTSTIAKGFQTEKLKLNKAYDTSIVHSALGNESALSRFKTFRGATELSSENYDELLWSFACGTTVFQPVSNSSSNNTTNMLSPLTNSYIINSDDRPVVNFEYKSIRAVIRVYARQSENGQTIDRSLHDYCENYSTGYPYITRVYMDMYEKVNDSWRKMNTYGYLGILIHNSTNYFSHTHAPSKTFQTGIIGNVVCAEYGSGANVPEITLLGLLSQRLSDNRIYTTDISIVSGDTVVTSDADGRGIFHIDYFEGFEEYCMHQCACFGIQFVTDSSYATTDIDNPDTPAEDIENVYMGILDENYVGHGDFVKGEKIFENELYDKEAEENEFVPDSESGDTGDHDSDRHSVGKLVGSRLYVTDSTNLSALMSEISTTAGESGQNYAEFISSITYFPYGYAIIGSVSTAGVPIAIFGHTFESKGVLYDRTYTRQTEPYYFSRRFNDFRDFAPYTKITVKIPYGDSVELNPAEWYGCGMRVVYAWDLSTGLGLATIYRISSLGELAYISMGCSPAQPLSVNAIMSGSYLNALHSAKSQLNSTLANTTLNASISATHDNPVGAISSIVNGFITGNEVGYQIQHMTRPTKRIGSSGSMGDYNFSNRVSITIERNRVEKDFNSNAYAMTTGFACCKSGKIGSEKGFVQANNIKLENCFLTETEKEMIIKLVETGVII